MLKEIPHAINQALSALDPDDRFPALVITCIFAFLALTTSIKLLTDAVVAVWGACVG